MKLKEHKFNQLELMLRQTEFVTLSQLQIGLANWEGARKPKQQISARQVLRYIKELEEVRCIRVETRRISDEFKEPAYRIYNAAVINTPGLTDEQFEQLMILIGNGKADDELREKLLHILSGARVASFYFRENGLIIEKAIKSRVLIVIGKYFSRKDDKCNLKLQPVRYDAANGRLYALRVDKINDKVRKYNLELMENIQLTDESYTPIFGFDPTKVECDAFGFMPGKIVYNVSLLLKPYAYSLLFRQFPHLMVLVEKLTTPVEEFYYRLQVKVYSIQPLARFVTGLLDQIKIEGDEKTLASIKKYIDDRVLGSLAQNFGEPEWIVMRNEIKNINNNKMNGITLYPLVYRIVKRAQKENQALKNYSSSYFEWSFRIPKPENVSEEMANALCKSILYSKGVGLEIYYQEKVNLSDFEATNLSSVLNENLILGDIVADIFKILPDDHDFELLKSI